MRRFGKSIRFKITQIAVLFTLALTVLLGTISFVFFQNYARRSVIQATEFNLQLVAGLVRQDIINLNSLSNRCTMDADVRRWLTSKAAVDSPAFKHTSVTAYEAVRGQYNLNRSYTYVQRLVVTDGAARILQLGGPSINSVPLTPYNLSLIPGMQDDSPSQWQSVTHDPYMGPSAPDCIYSVRPVEDPGTHARVGTVILSVSTQVLSDQLRSYQVAAGDKLCFSIGGQTWHIDGEAFALLDEPYTRGRAVSGAARSADTGVTEFQDAAGARYTVVSCPLGLGDMTLSHALAESTFAGQRNLLLLLLGGGCLLILVLGLGIAAYLNRTIMGPVGKMRARMDAIAAGDFSADPAIEWDNELGDVGRGINKLSHDVVGLMDSRLADEKAKQDLEYRMLQNQINPHFIYNTLNSIKWMATIQNATGIAEMTTAFSRLLKSVSKSNEELIPLREEFALLNDYCTIQQYRYGGSITLEIADISDEDLCGCLIPRFTLQPLAENAIFHGIEPKGGVGSIWLHISQTEQGDVSIMMEDDGVGMTPEAAAKIFAPDDEEEDRKKKFQQIGIRNVHRRIQYAFGPGYGITIESEPGRYTRMHILIPYLRPEGPKEVPQ